MKISDELIADFFTCKYKAYLRSNEHPFQITPFEEYLNCSRERLEASYLEKSKTISCTHFNHMDLDTESLFSVELNGWYNLKLVFEVRKGFVIPIHFSALVNDKDVISL